MRLDAPDDERERGREGDEHARVVCLRVGDATRERLGTPDLLFVGGPTHMRGMSSGMSRKVAMSMEEKADRGEGQHQGHGLEPEVEGPGLRRATLLLLAAPADAVLAHPPSPHDTTVFAPDHLERHVPTLGSEVVRLILDHPPTRVPQRRPVVLHHVAVLGHHECPITATDTTSATTSEVSDVVDRLECLLGLARGT